MRSWYTFNDIVLHHEKRDLELIIRADPKFLSQL